jgi:hypothetical protein
MDIVITRADLPIVGVVWWLDGDLAIVVCDPRVTVDQLTNALRGAAILGRFSGRAAALVRSLPRTTNAPLLTRPIAN